jgi:polar amino acid transport system substrate-binding protein
MGSELTLKGTDFDTIQFGSWPDDWTFSVASMSRSVAREKQFAFIGPYYYDQVVLVTSDALGLGFERNTLVGRNFGVCKGCIYELYLRGSNELYIDGTQSGPPLGVVNLTTFTTDFDVLRALGEDETPNIDYGVTSIFHAIYYEDRDFPISHDPVPLFVEPLWIVVPLDRKDDISAVKIAFESLRDSGRLAEISNIYLGDDFTSLPEND